MPRGGHGWGRQRGRSRRTARLMEPVLLLLLHQGLAHGYALLDQLSEFGLEQVDSSAVYRALRDMEAQGWVTSTWDEQETQGPPRRVYRLTAAGDKMLTLWMGDLRETRGIIDHLLESYRHHMVEGEGNHHDWHKDAAHTEQLR